MQSSELSSCVVKPRAAPGSTSRSLPLSLQAQFPQLPSAPLCVLRAFLPCLMVSTAAFLPFGPKHLFQPTSPCFWPGPP